MPYTPPSQQPPSSPTLSPSDASFQPGPRQSLPRSTSRLRKHRRTNSVDVSPGTLTPQGTAEDLPSLVSGASLHQPPWTDDHIIPKGAVISPPDSASSGSDEETVPEIRGRQTSKVKPSRDAVYQIPLSRPPQRPDGEGLKLMDNTHRPIHVSLSAGILDGLHSRSRRGVSNHVRSATEPQPALQPTEHSGEDDTDEDLTTKPPMVRKKSGELVRPALRAPLNRRPSSMPGTPVSSKAVHFDSHLEHVRHFLQVDRPLAVSAGSSPVEDHQNEGGYPFPTETSAPKGPPFEWDILTPNFPQDGPARRSQPVKLEKLWLSPDQRSMLGSVVVANYAFQKQVSCRFTLDHWKTTSEVMAEYCHEIRPRDGPVGYDRFSFSIKLSDTTNLESKTLYLCLRYSVKGQEFWDNNGGVNFHVGFRKSHVAQNGKRNFNGAARPLKNALPRSSRRAGGHSTLRSGESHQGDSDGDPQPLHGRSMSEYLGEPGPGLRMRTKSSPDISSDNIDVGLTSPRGVAFSNRYDFGASLNAAVHAAKDTMNKDRDALYMKDNVRSSRPVSDSPSTFGTNTHASSLPSTSYEELVNKYCFFGTKPHRHHDSHVTRNHGSTSASTTGHTGPELPGDSNTPRRTNLTSHHYVPVAAESISTPSVSAPNFGAAEASDAPSYQTQLPERFSWRGDTHTTPTIRG